MLLKTLLRASGPFVVIMSNLWPHSSNERAHKSYRSRLFLSTSLGYLPISSSHVVASGYFLRIRSSLVRNFLFWFYFITCLKVAVNFLFINCFVKFIHICLEQYQWKACPSWIHHPRSDWLKTRKILLWRSEGTVTTRDPTTSRCTNFIKSSQNLLFSVSTKANAMGTIWSSTSKPHVINIFPLYLPDKVHHQFLLWVYSVWRPLLPDRIPTTLLGIIFH
jgi:hypothetical protein